MEIHCGWIELKILNVTISEWISNECNSYLKLHSLYLETEEEDEDEDEDEDKHEDEDDPILTSQQLRAILDSLKS